MLSSRRARSSHVELLSSVRLTGGRFVSRGCRCADADIARAAAAAAAAWLCNSIAHGVNYVTVSLSCYFRSAVRLLTVTLYMAVVKPLASTHQSNGPRLCPRT